MAHPEEVAPSIPDTLPEDFGDWDGEASAVPEKSSAKTEAARFVSEPSAARGQSSYRDAQRTQRGWSSNPQEPAASRQSESAKPVAQSSAREAVFAPREARTAAFATAVAEPQKKATAEPAKKAAVAVEEEHTSYEIAKTRMREADEAIYELFSAKNVEVKEEKKPSKSKWMMVAAVGACSILLSFGLTLALGHHGARAATNQPIQSFSGATQIPVSTNVQKPAAGEPLVQAKPSPAVEAQQTTDDQAAQQDNAAPAVSETQTKMMNDQLAAPRMIQRDAIKQVAEDAPPPVSIGAAGVDGMGGRPALPGVFNGHAQSVVQAPPPKPIAISSGVAIGMLVHQTAPIYPPIAKSARVSGIVELHATIAQNGVIKDLYVVKGPQMLRQAALDAVRNWRYKPYTLNNQPIDVDTTINVSFTLGN